MCVVLARAGIAAQHHVIPPLQLAVNLLAPLEHHDVGVDEAEQLIGSHVQLQVHVGEILSEQQLAGLEMLPQRPHMLSLIANCAAVSVEKFESL